MINEETKVFIARVLRFAFVVYYVVSLTFRFCFRAPGMIMFEYAHVAFFDYLADLFFLYDFVTRFRSNVVVPVDVVRNSNANTSRRSTSQSRYKRSMQIIHAVDLISLNKASTWKMIKTNAWEVINILSFFPSELIAYAIGMPDAYFLRVTRFIKVRDYFIYWQDISDILHHFKIANTSYAIKRVFLLIITLAVVAHIGACFFYAISVECMRNGSTDAWVYVDNLVGLDEDHRVIHLQSLPNRYLRSLYWSTQALDAVGFGDLTPKNEAETWFCILFMYLCACCVYYTIANLMEVMTNYDSARTAALLKQSRFEQYAIYRRLPKDLVERVRSYYNHQWKLLKGVDEREIHAQLPPSISQQVKQVIIRDLLVQVEVLADLNKGLLNSLTDSMDSFVYNPQDIIIDRDSRVSGMYIVATGEVHVVSGGGSKSNLQSKQAFAIAALVKSYTSCSTFTAKNFVEVLYLKGSVFRHISKGYMTKPEFDEFTKKKLKFYYDKEKDAMKTHSGTHALSRKSSLHLNRVVNKLMSIVLPDSELRLLWDSITFLCLNFYLASLPLMLAVTLHDDFISGTFGLLVCGFLVDWFFLIDSAMRCRYFGYHDEGIVETQPDKIWKHFWKVNPWPVLFLEVFPLDIIVGLGVNFKLYSVLRLLKLLHMRKIMRSTDRFVRTITYYSGWAISFEMFRFIGLYYVLFELVHWIGCIWRLVAKVGASIFHYNSNWLTNDRNAIWAVDYQSMASVEYLRSVYWAVSVLSSIGFPDILAVNTLEYAVIILIMFFGYLYFNTCLGAIANLMGSFNREKREFDLKVDKIKQVVQFNNIPTSIESSIIHYFDHLWTRYNGINEVEVLDSLPLTLKGAVIQHVVGPLVTSIPFFAKLSEPMENMLLSMFEVRSFLDGDPLMIAGELGKEMYIIEKGSVQVTSKDQSVVFAKLGTGSYVGESCLLEISARTASVYAVGYVDTYVISNDTFLKAAEKFPEEYDSIVKEIALIIETKKKKNEELKRQHDLVVAVRTAELVKMNSQALSSTGESGNQSDSSERRGRNTRAGGPPANDQDSTPVPAKGHSIASMNVSGSNLHEKRSPSSPWFFIAPVHPASTYRVAWDVVMFFVCMYTAYVFPLRMVVVLPESLFWVDYSLDAVTLVDSYFFATAFGRYKAGQLVMDNSKILALYIQEDLPLDLAMNIPYDLIAIVNYYVAPKYTYFIRSILRLPKLLKLFFISDYFKRVERLCIDYNLNYLLLRFAVLTTLVLMIAHWVACGWMLFANNGLQECTEANGSGVTSISCQYAGTWVEQQYLYDKLPADGGSAWDRYVRSFNWALPSLTAALLGDIFAMNQDETLFSFLIIFCGLSINGVIIGSIVALVSDANLENTRMFRNITVLSDYLISKQLPSDLIQTSVGFLHFLTTPEGMFTSSRDAVFAELPHSMKTAIDKHMKTLPYLRHCPFFDFCSDELLRGISSKLRTQIYAKNDKIINFGDLGHEMFFLEKGSVDVVSGDGHTLFATLEEGSFFGETAVFFKCTRAATVKCASPYCVCLVLTKADLNYELRTLDYDDEEILDTFRNLQLMNERRNKAVRQNLTFAKDHDHKLFKMIKTNDHVAKLPWTARLRAILTPDSVFRAAWDVVGLVWVLYYTFSIPLYVAFFFGPDVETYSDRVIYEVLISIFWMTDIVLKTYLFSYYSDPTGKILEKDGDKIKAHYMSSPVFKYDIISSLPYEVLILAPGISSTSVFMIRTLHLFRVLQLMDYIDLIQAHSKNFLQIGLERSSSLVMKAGLAFVILNHWLACGFFMVHRYSERHSPISYVIADGLADYDPTTHKHNICNSTLRYCYSRSLYFVLSTMTSVGFGDITPYTNREILFQQLVIVLGAYVSATFMGFCGTYQSDLDSSGENGFKRNMHRVESFIKYRKLPGNLHESITTQFTYMYKRANSLQGDRNELMGRLSAPSRMELALFLNDEVLQSVPIFRTSCAQLQRRLAVRLKPQFVMEGSYLYRAGDIGPTVFFMFSGRIEIKLSTDRKTLDAFGFASLRLLLHKQSEHGTHYERGDHFGEFCLLSNSGLRAETALALTGSEVYYLVKEELWEEFLYISPNIRRQFIFELFTRVGRKVHIGHTLDDVPESDYEGDTRIISLYRMAFGILEDIYDHMDSCEEGQDGSDGEHSIDPIDEVPGGEEETPRGSMVTGAREGGGDAPVGGTPGVDGTNSEDREARTSVVSFDDQRKLTGESGLLPRRSDSVKSRRVRRSTGGSGQGADGEKSSSLAMEDVSDTASPRHSDVQVTRSPEAQEGATRVSLTSLTQNSAEHGAVSQELLELIREGATTVTHGQKDFDDMVRSRDRKSEAKRRWHFSADAIINRRRLPPSMAAKLVSPLETTADAPPTEELRRDKPSEEHMDTVVVTPQESIHGPTIAQNESVEQLLPIVATPIDQPVQQPQSKAAIVPKPASATMNHLLPMTSPSAITLSAVKRLANNAAAATSGAGGMSAENENVLSTTDAIRAARRVTTRSMPVVQSSVTPQARSSPIPMTSMAGIISSPPQPMRKGGPVPMLVTSRANMVERQATATHHPSVGSPTSADEKSDHEDAVEMVDLEYSG